MPQPLVSVIIPTHNRYHYLRQAVDSVYAQSHQNFEIIVVDDSSSDETANIATEYDDRLHYHAQPRSGVSAARNYGIRQASGEYIAFLDDDDLYQPDKLQLNLAYFAQHPDIAWLCSGFDFIDAQADTLVERTAIIPQEETVTLHDIAMFRFIHTSSVILHKRALPKGELFPMEVSLSEDYHAWASVLSHHKGAAMKACLTRFRQHAGNTPLPPFKLWRENTRIIDNIMASKVAGLQTKAQYTRNLQGIIKQNLLHKKNYGPYLLFCLATFKA